MGISGLWTSLEVPTLTGAELARHVEGKVLAIDASIWLVEATTETSYVHDGRHVRVAFERVGHYLRMGALPLLVFEGTPPPEKLGALNQRRKARNIYAKARTSTGKKNPAFAKLAEDVQRLLDIMGLPWEQAEGEGEALCAQLYRQGSVDAVVTNDGDALLYGTRKVYKDLRLHTNLVSQHHRGEWLDVTAALPSFSSQDFLVAALLSGGDFLLEGVHRVGFKGTVNLLDALHRRHRKASDTNETSLLDLLRTVLTEPVDPALLAPGAGLCSTCRTCRHGGVRKDEHGVHGCEECGTHTKTRGGSGVGGCRPVNNNDEEEDEASCPCPPCQRRDERTLQMLAHRASECEGGLTRYVRRFDEARAAYEAAGAVGTDEDAEEEMEGVAAPRFTWLRRPDFATLKNELVRVYGADGSGHSNIARKILPLALEWDARTVGVAIGHETTELTAGDLRTAAEYGFWFAPLRIDRVCLLGIGKEKEAAWRFSMEFVAVSKEAQALVNEAAAGMTTQGRDSSDALPTLMAILSEGRGCLRQNLVRAQFPGLVRAFEEAKRKKTKTPSKPKKKQGGGNVAARQSSLSPGRTLEHYFTPSPSPPKASKRASSYQIYESPPRVASAARALESEAAVAGTPGGAAAAVAISSRSTPPPPPRKGKRPGAACDEVELVGTRRNLDCFFKRVRVDEEEADLNNDDEEREEEALLDLPEFDHIFLGQSQPAPLSSDEEEEEEEEEVSVVETAWQPNRARHVECVDLTTP